MKNNALTDAINAATRALTESKRSKYLAYKNEQEALRNQWLEAQANDKLETGKLQRTKLGNDIALGNMKINARQNLPSQYQAMQSGEYDQGQFIANMINGDVASDELAKYAHFLNSQNINSTEQDLARSFVGMGKALGQGDRFTQDGLNRYENQQQNFEKDKLLAKDNAIAKAMGISLPEYYQSENDPLKKERAKATELGITPRQYIQHESLSSSQTNPMTQMLNDDKALNNAVNQLQGAFFNITKPKPKF
ncbi:MAG: hypothetical protein GY793_08575 [Proteobacteria bacterium]|nr:hypothetical protein [Pseudomonadota bacterium]